MSRTRRGKAEFGKRSTDLSSIRNAADRPESSSFRNIPEFRFPAGNAFQIFVPTVPEHGGIIYGWGPEGTGSGTVAAISVGLKEMHRR